MLPLTTRQSNMMLERHTRSSWRAVASASRDPGGPPPPPLPPLAAAELLVPPPRSPSGRAGGGKFRALTDIAWDVFRAKGGGGSNGGNDGAGCGGGRVPRF